MIVSSTEITLSRESGRSGRGKRVEKRTENYEDKQNFLRGANRRRKSAMLAKAGSQIQLTDWTKKSGFSFAWE
jgi:hypothetical protein